MKKYNIAVFIGRFQPFHHEHLKIIENAYQIADKVIIIVGSACKPRTDKNPFSFDERKQMISGSIWNNRSAFGDRFRMNDFIIESNVDTIYNDTAWATRIQQIVNKHASPTDSVTLVGCKKDDTTYYLDMFPQWALNVFPFDKNINATDIRSLYFKENSNLDYIDKVVPYATLRMLELFKKTPEYEQVVNEVNFNNTYRKQFDHLPYPPIFVTTDAVVNCCGHVLMIRRRSEPGKGLWALPGGFVNAKTDESLQSACLRELREETGLKVPQPVLIGNIKDSRPFDAIGRSSRGRTITHAFYIELTDKTLPKVKGSDDADKAKWIPLSKVRSDECFEDHFEIIHYFMGTPIVNE